MSAPRRAAETPTREVEHMATKRIKQSPASAHGPSDTAHTLWLAGLGALSLAQKRGGALLSGLIAEGHDFQTRAQKLAQEVSSDAAVHVKGALAPFRAGLKRNV